MEVQTKKLENSGYKYLPIKNPRVETENLP